MRADKSALILPRHSKEKRKILVTHSERNKTKMKSLVPSALGVVHVINILQAIGQPQGVVSVVGGKQLHPRCGQRSHWKARKQDRDPDGLLLEDVKMMVLTRLAGTLKFCVWRQWVPQLFPVLHRL